MFINTSITTLIMLMILSCKKNSDLKIENSESIKYENYIEDVNHKISELSIDRKKQREKWLNELKTNSVYIDLVNKSSISPEYLPLLNAISDAIKNTYSIDGKVVFGISEDLDKYIVNSDNGEQKINFVVIVSSLSIQMNGGIPKEIVNVFDRYRTKYNLYGNDNTIIHDNAGKSVKIERGYNLSYAFGLFDPSDKKVLDAIYETVQEGISQWNEKGDQIYENGFMALKSDYMRHLKEVYPDSPYFLDVDFEMTSSELYKAYEENEVSADEKYKGKKIAITGIIDNIGKDPMDNPYISFKENYLQGITCYFSEKNIKDISQLNKGDKITIIGECRGFVLTNVIIRKCDIWNN